MENKSFILGSCLAVVVLVLASLSPAVGFRTVKSSFVKDSPLFNVRTKRAIGEEQEGLTADYIGKGKENGIFFPIRDKNSFQIYRIIQRMSQMNDETRWFTTLQLNREYLDKLITNEDLHKILNRLPQTKGNPQEIMNMLIDESDDLLIGGWTIFNPVCLIIIFGLLFLFEVWTYIISIYLITSLLSTINIERLKSLNSFMRTPNFSPKSASL